MRRGVRFAVDIVSEGLLFALMCYQFTGQASHEILGALMLAVFVVHHILNAGYYKALFKGKYTARRTLTLVVDTLLLFDLLALAVSGMGMSRYVFRFMNFILSASLSRQIHMVAGFSGFLLSGFHLGLHLPAIGAALKKALRLKLASKTAALIPRLLCLCVSGYGVYVVIKRGFFRYITLQQQFLMFDPTEPVILYLLDLSAVTVLASALGWLCVKLTSLRKKLPCIREGIVLNKSTLTWLTGALLPRRR